MGTCAKIGLRPDAENAQSLDRLKAFVQKYAAPGAHINVYISRKGLPQMNYLTTISKIAKSYCQAPGCSLPDSNGIYAGEHVINPIAASAISQNWLPLWDQTQSLIQTILKSDRVNAAPCDSEPNQGGNETLYDSQMAAPDTSLIEDHSSGELPESDIDDE